MNRLMIEQSKLRKFSFWYWQKKKKEIVKCVWLSSKFDVSKSSKIGTNDNQPTTNSHHHHRHHPKFWWWQNKVIGDVCNFYRSITSIDTSPELHIHSSILIRSQRTIPSWYGISHVSPLLFYRWNGFFHFLLCVFFFHAKYLFDSIHQRIIYWKLIDFMRFGFEKWTKQKKNTFKIMKERQSESALFCCCCHSSDLWEQHRSFFFFFCWSEHCI